MKQKNNFLLFPLFHYLALNPNKAMLRKILQKSPSPHNNNTALIKQIFSVDTALVRKNN